MLHSLCNPQRVSYDLYVAPIAVYYVYTIEYRMHTFMERPDFRGTEAQREGLGYIPPKRTRVTGLGQGAFCRMRAARVFAQAQAMVTENARARAY